MAVTIKTDNKWRDMVYRQDVPATVLAKQFDHLSEDDAPDGFFCYRGYWYHVSDFLLVAGQPELIGWNGYTSDSYFSGVVIKIAGDGERVMCGTYYS